MKNYENGQELNVSKMDIVWVILKTWVTFAFLRILCMNLFHFDNLAIKAAQLVIFTYCIYRYVHKEAINDGLTLKDCYILPVRIGGRDFVFALMIVSAFSLCVALLAERIVPTNVEIGSFLVIAIGNFFYSGLGSGINEELIFRGYLLKTIEKRIGKVWAIILTSLVFGLGHALNGGMTPMEMLWIVIGTGCFGLMTAVITYRTGNIWRGVLIHMFMNTKERFLGFDRASSLFVYDFPTGWMGEMRSCVTWIIVSVISLCVVTWCCWTQRNRSKDK